MLVKPIIKWAGGKTQLLDELKPRMPKNVKAMAEPFAGGLALSLSVMPDHLFANDFNKELVNLYRVIRGPRGVSDVMRIINATPNTEAAFLAIRNEDIDPGLDHLSKTQRAARFLFLNKTAFNGLYRVNSSGRYNVPFGHYAHPSFDEENLRAVSAYLRKAAESIYCLGFNEFVSARLVDAMGKDPFFYFDPPYHATFTGYNAGGFSEDDQRRLRAKCDFLTGKKVPWMLSNTDDAFINELFDGYRIEHILAHRFINSNGDGRNGAGEVIVMNYDGDGNILGRR
jgi:DNA adenine methylase